MAESLKILADVSAISVLIPLIYFFRKAGPHGKEIKSLGLLLFAAALTDMVCRFMIKQKLNVNLPANLYEVFQFGVLSFMYLLALERKFFLVILTLMSLCLAFALYNLVLFQGIFTITSYSMICFSLALIIYSLLYFYKLLTQLPEQFIHRIPFFWVNTAVLIYFSGNLFLFVFTHYMVDKLTDSFLVYWSLHNILNIIKNILFAVGLHMSSRQPTRSSENAL